MEETGIEPGVSDGRLSSFGVLRAETTSERMSMLMIRLLWDPLPETLPSPGRRRFRRLRELAAAMTVSADPLSVEEQVDRRVCRRAVQALVRGAYLATVAEQDSARRPPSAFAEAWRAHLAGLLDRDNADLADWGPVKAADLDSDLVWSLYELASRARQDAIGHAVAAPSRRVRRGQQVPAFEFSIVSDGDSLGDVTYGTCESCGVGLLYKIGFPDDWQFCGFGSLALSQLEVRHPDLTWYTTGQLKNARGFYDRYRQASGSPWTPMDYPCAHFG
jgi:hypothetical protein